MSSSENNNNNSDSIGNTEMSSMLASEDGKDGKEDEEEGGQQQQGEQDPAIAEWDKAEAQAAAKARSQSPVSTAAGSDSTASPDPSEKWKKISVKVRKTCMHRAFICLVYASVCIHMAMLVAQVIGVYFYWMNSIEGILRCYVIAMSICGIFVELELTEFIRKSAILQFWMTRGVFYSLIGLLGMLEVNDEAAGKNLDALSRDSLVFFVVVMSYIMVGLGLFYYVMGILCVQYYKHKVYKDYEKRCKEIEMAQKGFPSPTPAQTGGRASPTAAIVASV